MRLPYDFFFLTISRDSLKFSCVPSNASILQYDICETLRISLIAHAVKSRKSKELQFPWWFHPRLLFDRSTRIEKRSSGIRFSFFNYLSQKLRDAIHAFGTNAQTTEYKAEVLFFDASFTLVHKVLAKCNEKYEKYSVGVYSQHSTSQRINARAYTCLLS